MLVGFSLRQEMLFGSKNEVWVEEWYLGRKNDVWVEKRCSSLKMVFESSNCCLGKKKKCCVVGKCSMGITNWCWGRQNVVWFIKSCFRWKNVVQVVFRSKWQFVPQNSVCTQTMLFGSWKWCPGRVCVVKICLGPKNDVWVDKILFGSK